MSSLQRAGLKLNTFSIVARCSQTGMLGVGVATRFPAVGATCPHVEAGVGAVATQSWVNPLLGKKALQLLAEGKTASQTLEEVLKTDPGRDLRQLAIVDASGNCAVHTGEKNSDYKGHLVGDGFVVQGNCLASEDTLLEMKRAFSKNEGPLPERILNALMAGDKAGGDKRGKQSAALRVEYIPGFPYADLRVDDYPQPIMELERIYRVYKEALLDKYLEWVESIKKGVPLE